MLRKFGLVLLVFSLSLAVLSGVPAAPAHAQGANAWTSYDLNMRTGPGTDYDIVVTLGANTGLILEARNADTSWVLARTEDGTQRGWLAAIYLNYAPGTSAASLPVSNEILNAPAPAAADNPPADDPAPASGGVNARTVYQMNVRSGPGTSHSAVGQVPANTGLVLEARNADASWVLAHTEDGAIRGWLSSMYLTFTGVTASSLPFSDEIVSGGGSPTVPTTDNVDYYGIKMGGYDPALIKNIDLTALPIVPEPTARAYAIYQTGRAKGNNPNVVAKVGDCSSEHWYFLSPFAGGQYNLGSYPELQGVIDHFGDSLGFNSEATHNGFNVNSVMQTQWANPAFCQNGETPLTCEYRIHKPSVSIIMFGTSDLLVMTPYEFDFYMRDIVDQTIEAGIIPVLSTFPGNLGFWDRTILYNQIVARIAMDYNIPLINLWLALEKLPNKGLEPDGFHLGEPLEDPGSLSTANLQTGYPTRNLITLQTLDKLRRSVLR